MGAVSLSPNDEPPGTLIQELRDDHSVLII